MAKVLMTDPDTERVVLFEEAPGGGSFEDPNSDRNRPLKDPMSWLDLIKFNSDFDYYQVHSGPTPVTVNHAAIAGASTSLGATGMVTRSGRFETNTYDLVTHGLGYVPRYMVISSGRIVAPGTLLSVATGQNRNVTPFATSTKICLHETALAGSSTLSGISVDYEVIVFRQPTADSPYPRDFDPVTGRVILGYGKFDSLYKVLRKAGASASPFDISLGPTLDGWNGSIKVVLADGTTLTEPNYTGSFTGSPSIQCAVED